ncbi:glycosyltransferase family 2 protein [Ohtaekwangia sp.]|uniref:glycosyltransferase family 2 protein n=1 Tax=Ohtaekwangia sp. TaxID=2066019 RepID=UPI002FDE8B04
MSVPATDPFFSVIIPTYNRAAQICDAVNSVVLQTYKLWEVIVVDDGSSDNTKSVLESIKDERVRYLYQQNAGVSTARNTGAAAAKGKYLLFLDSDDRFTEGYLESLSVEFAKNSCTIGFGYARYIDPNGKEIVHVKPEKSNGKFGPPLAGAFAISKELFQLIGGYDTKLAYSENTEFFLRLKLQKKLHENSVCIVDREGVIVNFRDSRERFNTYSSAKYKSIAHFLKKHADYFANEPEAFANYKTIYALGAFQHGDIDEARKSIGQVIMKKPLRLKAYLQYLLFAIPFLARLYWKQPDTR